MLTVAALLPGSVLNTPHNITLFSPGLQLWAATILLKQNEFSRRNRAVLFERMKRPFRVVLYLRNRMLCNMYSAK